MYWLLAAYGIAQASISFAFGFLCRDSAGFVLSWLGEFLGVAQALICTVLHGLSRRK